MTTRDNYSMSDVVPLTFYISQVEPDNMPGESAGDWGGGSTAEGVLPGKSRGPSSLRLSFRLLY